MTTAARRQPAAREAAPDRRGRTPAGRRLSRHLDLEDPLPRGRRADGAAPHAGRLPAVQRGRSRAPEDDPAHAARGVSAAARDQGRARRARQQGAQAQTSGTARDGRGRRSHSTSSATAPAISLELAKELEEFGLLSPRGSGGDKRYPESDTDVAATCARLARYGVAPRHLRTFRTAAGREASLLGQLVAPSLRARNNDRRTQGLRELQQLAELASELQSLLFWRDLRDLAAQ